MLGRHSFRPYPETCFASMDGRCALSAQHTPRQNPSSCSAADEQSPAHRLALLPHCALHYSPWFQQWG